jgi:hypothetical protein
MCEMTTATGWVSTGWVSTHLQLILLLLNTGSRWCPSTTVNVYFYLMWLHVSVKWQSSGHLYKIQNNVQQTHVYMCVLCIYCISFMHGRGLSKQESYHPSRNIVWGTLVYVTVAVSRIAQPRISLRYCREAFSLSPWQRRGELATEHSAQ